MPLSEQILVFAWTVAIGIFNGLCYELYRAVRDVFGFKKIGTYAGDMVFWLLITACSFILLLRANYGQLRLYVFIGILIGSFIFIHFIGENTYRLNKCVLILAGRFICLVARFLYYVWTVLVFPFKVIAAGIFLPFRVVYGYAKVFLKKFYPDR